ncbi:MAG: mannosylglucosylglycerate synthase [Actinomycetota bacterium]|nr:mannosylglucosylglycerate synthase [Actinomycetota bacterium]
MSFRLGGADGVAIEAEKWSWALRELGYHVRRVAGAIEDGGEPDDIVLPGLGFDAAGGGSDAAAGPVDADEVAAAFGGADLVVVENLCSLPLNIDAAHAVARAAAEHRGRVVFHHHDLPWQRRHLAHLASELPPRVEGALHATINLRSRRELEARGFAGATTVHNYFDLDPAPGDRDATRAKFGFADDELVVLQPSRAIERKNVPGAVRFASYVARRAPDRHVHLWIAGPAEEGYADTLARVVERSDVPVTIGRATEVADAYAASDAVVFPSTWEGFGNPVIESIAARRACAAFPYPVLAEIVAAGVRCFSTELPDVIVRFLAESEQRRETYFDVNLRRARLSFSLADLPAAIDQAFTAHGWSS